jgi:hypothetical protein
MEIKRLIAYLWPLGAYRDAANGNYMERAAAFRHNEKLARSLPLYINRWAVSASVELVLTQTLPAAVVPVVGILFTGSICAITTLTAIWMLFKRG